MRWIRPSRGLEQVETKVDPPDDGIDPAPRPYQGYPVTMVVNGKRVVVYAYD